MEMLNAMFNELERTHVTEALEDCEDKGAVSHDSTDHISPILRDGGEIKVKDLLEAVQRDGDSAKVRERERKGSLECYLSSNCHFKSFRRSRATASPTAASRKSRPRMARGWCSA